jgi:hypothetical protein
MRKVIWMHHNRLEQQVAHLPAGLQSITLWDHSIISASMVSGMELCLACDLLLGAPPNKEQLATNYKETSWNSCTTFIIMLINI